MQGTERIYGIVTKAKNYGLNGLILNYGGFSTAIRRGPIVLVAGEHARGKTCHVFLKNNNDTLEVYGVTGGQLGWTETYGWLIEGPWIQAIEKLLTELTDEIYKKEQEKIEKENSQYKLELQKKEEIINKFKELF